MRKLAHHLMLLCLFALIVMGTVIILINTNKGQKFVTNFIEKTVTQNIGHKIKITNFRVSLPCNIKADHVAIADKEGNWLEVENIEIKVQPLNLFHREISISKLEATNIVISYIPEFSIKKREDNSEDLKFRVSLKDIRLPLIILDPLLTNLDKDLEISLKGNLTYDQAQKLSFNFNYVLKDLNSSLKDIKITAIGSYEINDKILDIEHAKVNTDAVSTSGFIKINFANNEIAGKYNLECVDLGNINPDLKGCAKDELTIRGTLKNFIVDGKLEIENLKVRENNVQVSELNHKLQYDSEHKIGNFNILSQDNDLKFSANFGIENDLIKIDQLEFLYKENKVSSNISYNLKQKGLHGNVELFSKDLNSIFEIAGLDINGKARALLNFSLIDNAQAIDVNIESDDLTINEFHTSLLNAKIFIKDMWQMNLASAKVRFEKITHKAQEIFKTFLFNCVRKDEILSFTITGSSKLSKELDFEMSGDFITEDFKSFVLNLNKTSAKFGDHRVKGLGQTTINYDNKLLKYNVPGVNIDGGIVSAHGIFNDKNITSTISFKRLLLASGDLSLPKEFASSKLNGEVQLSGDYLNPIINTYFTISNIHLIGNDNTEFTINSTYKENLLEINSAIKSAKEKYSDFKASLPMELSIKPYKLEFKKDESIKGNLNLNLKVDPITALFLPPIHRVKGILSAKLSVAGTMNSPMVKGDSFIKDGKYEHASLGVKIKNINSHISAVGKNIVIKKFKADDGDGGTISGNGKLDLNKKNMPYEVSLIANDFYFLNHPNVQATINANLKVEGNSSCASVKGNIEPSPLEIQLPERFAKDIPEINVVSTVYAQKSEEEATSGSLFDEYAIDTDISLNAKRKIFVRGWGLDAELEGKLTCKGFIEDPVIRGKLEIIRGRYQEFGKQFTFKRGILNFEDSIPPAPYLDIVGSTIQDDAEIRIILSGPVLKPNLSIESTPSMPQEEALSTLLFGKQTTQISPFQALQLTDSLRRLSGRGNGSLNILNKARGILKVDDIKIKNNSSDPKDAALGVGKYLTDKVYLEIEKGTQAGSGKTKVEVEIRNNLSVESSVGEAGSNSIGLNWRKDY